MRAADPDYLIKYYGNGRGVPATEREDDNDFWTQFSEASFMPTLVMSLVFQLAPQQAPFFVRPLVSLIFGQVRARFTDPDLKRKIAFTQAALEKESADGRAWFAGGDKDGNPTAADYQMLFVLEAITSGRIEPEKVPDSFRHWVEMVHQRPAYRRAYDKGGAYDYAKL